MAKRFDRAVSSDTATDVLVREFDGRRSYN